MQLIEIVGAYLRHHHEEAAELSSLSELLRLRSPSQLISRKDPVGHVTASAIIVSRKTREVLLFYHKRHRRNLQPGGHLIESDTSPLAAAIRMAASRSQLTDLEYVPFHFDPALPIDIDCHTILPEPEEGESEHIHCDFRYVFLTGATGAGVSNRHSLDAPHWDRLAALRRDVTFKRLVPKLEDLLSADFQSRRFYGLVTRELPKAPRSAAIVVTHLLPDAVEFLGALGSISDILAVIPKPRSKVDTIAKRVNRDFPVRELERRDFESIDKLLEMVPQGVDRLVLFDIGGWFAPIANKLSDALGSRFVGVVEDTENGHQKYVAEDAKAPLLVPVISVARSPLKDNEDFLVGQSVVFSADAILRDCGKMLQYLRCGVVGYGKIGRSIAHHLVQRGATPHVYEIDPIRLIAARNHQCAVVPRDELFSSCDVVFCATGRRAADIEQFRLLRSGAFVFSVTSADDEMDLAFLDTQYAKEQFTRDVERYSGFSNYFYLVNQGNAVNFLHKAVLGDYICLVRAEMMWAQQRLLLGTVPKGLSELDASDRADVARVWIRGMLGWK